MDATKERESIFMDWEEVAERLGYKRSTTSTLIKKSNEEVKAMGLPVRPGKMRRDYFKKYYQTFEL